MHQTSSVASGGCVLRCDVVLLSATIYSSEGLYSVARGMSDECGMLIEWSASDEVCNGIQYNLKAPNNVQYTVQQWSAISGTAAHVQLCKISVGVN